MSEYVTLCGAEKVENAGYVMRDAADKMQRSASQIDESLQQHQRFLTEWLGTLEQIMHEAKP